MKYMKIFNEFEDYIERLNNEERGRLFTAMLRYSRTGEILDMPGNEQYLWAVAKSHLDRMEEQYRKTCAANAANARKKSKAPAQGEDAAPVREDAAPAVEAPAGPQPSAAPAEGYHPTVAAVLPLAGGGEYPVYPDRVAEWERRYPGADVPGEIGKMRSWLLAHPQRLTARKDVIPFILRWLEKSPRRRRPGTAVPSREGPSYDLEEIRQLMIQNSAG